jgi:hypothetical protein
MICPSCKCEYIRGVTQCSDCGVPLVDRLEPEKASLDDVRIVPVWRGSDASECERVAEALESADIPCTKANSQSLFGSRPNETTLEIWVAEANRGQAEVLISKLDADGSSDELAPEESAELSLPDSDQPDEEDEEADSLEDLSQEWHEDDPVSEVWNGESEPFAENLILCLREIGIASRKLQEGARWSVVVRPEQEKRAKEIVREVVEASPPE